MIIYETCFISANVTHAMNLKFCIPVWCFCNYLLASGIAALSEMMAQAPLVKLA